MHGVNVYYSTIFENDVLIICRENMLAQQVQIYIHGCIIVITRSN